MKISFIYEEKIEQQLIVDVIQHRCNFIPVGRGQVEFMEADQFSNAKDYGWPLNLAREFCYTHMFSEFARRNNVFPYMATWDIPDNKVAEIVSIFCLLGADVKTHEDIITFVV